MLSTRFEDFKFYFCASDFGFDFVEFIGSNKNDTTTVTPELEALESSGENITIITPPYERTRKAVRMRLTLNPQWRLRPRPLNSVLGFMDIKTGQLTSNFIVQNAFILTEDSAETCRCNCCDSFRCV